MTQRLAIQVDDLTKVYPPDLRAIDGLSLNVAAGEIMALLGPNGAGKSTTIRVLSTLSGFDSGRAIVGGTDVDRDPEAVRRTIGVVAQKTGVDYFLTGYENLRLQGQMYRMKRADIGARIDELAAYFGLKDNLDQPVASYSGGMARRLDIASALIHQPRILFLDEPTLGLDIRSRKTLWQHITELNRDFGLTILLTTHYLEEADRLAHRVAIINEGRIRIVGTPDELKSSIRGDSVLLALDAAGPAERAFADQLRQAGVAADAVWDGTNLHLYAASGAEAVPRIVRDAEAAGVTIRSLSFSRPTLDDVFLRYTGTSMREAPEEEEGEQWWTQWAGKGGGGDWKKMAAKWGYVESSDDEAEWEGNEWVDRDGKPRLPRQDAPVEPGPEDQPTAPSPSPWKGNRWIDGDGHPRESLGDSPGWKGNEWVDEEGEFRNPPWQPQEAGDGVPGSSPDQTGGLDPESGDPDGAGSWEGNRWIDRDGRPRESLGDSPDWKGNEWVDEQGQPRGSWGRRQDGS